MTTSVTIGEFSRLTHLSVKALRHYHDVDLLVPAEIDPQTGYRRYVVGQVHTAQLISRLRSLRMPLPELRALLQAGDETERNRLLHGHLRRMEDELDRTRQVVSSLRALLTPAGPELEVQLRDSPPIQVLAIRETVDRDDIFTFCDQAFRSLHDQLAAHGVAPGETGATYADEFFTEDRGEVVAYLGLPDGADLPARDSAVRRRLPGGRFAVAMHAGSYLDFDRTYGALGGYVAEHLDPVRAPIREVYLLGPDGSDQVEDYRTEVCWPVAA